jgi:hypothetical protein
MKQITLVEKLLPILSKGTALIHLLWKEPEVNKDLTLTHQTQTFFLSLML